MLEDSYFLKSSPIMLIGSFRATAVTIAAHTVAAPPISALIASIEEDGFREIPPLPANRGRGQNSVNVMFLCNKVMG